MLDITFLSEVDASGDISHEIIDIPDALYEELIAAKFFSFSKQTALDVPDPDYPGETVDHVVLTPSLRSKFIGCLLALIAKKAISFCSFSLLVKKNSEHEDLLYSIEILFKLFSGFRQSKFKYLSYI
jgi:hypothetical protein